MNNVRLLPRLAWSGIRKNKTAYFPYILTYTFSVAVFFILISIIQNPILDNVPRADYLQILMMIGSTLLGLIIMPFLIATNGFLMKRRKKELGLYSMLGMEKKHIGMILLIETGVIYVVSVGFGILSAVVFSKLIFLLLIYVTGLPVEAHFMLEAGSVQATLIYYGVLSAINLVVSLFRVSMTNPAELFKESRKGEKEVRHVGVWTAAGIAAMGGGYWIALRSQMNMMIFTDFFLSVALVVAGTHLLFTSGSVVFLGMMKKNKKYYYKAGHFITVSGMLYRLKKSASDLVNICIFSTMVMITLLCTVALFCGESGAVRYLYPYDNSVRFYADLFTDREGLAGTVADAAGKTGVQVRDMSEMTIQNVRVKREENRFVKRDDKAMSSQDHYTLKLITLEDFNRVEQTEESLESDEVLVYSCARDFGRPELTLMEDVYRVKKEYREVSFEPKEEKSMTKDDIYVVMKDEQMFSSYAAAYNGEPQVSGVPVEFNSDRYYYLNYNMVGPQEACEELTSRVAAWSAAQAGFIRMEDINEGEKDMKSMYGGLLFIGVFFGIIFSVCLVLIIYYKQITEGYEDQNAFSIMKKVGMDDGDIRTAIRKQIQTVFFLPFAAAVVHAFVSLNIVSNLMRVLNVYDEKMILTSLVCVIAAFGAFYMLSYLITAREYYKIVR